VPVLGAEDLDKQVGRTVGDARMVGKMLRRRHQYDEFHELSQAVEIAQMLSRYRKCVVRSNARGLLAFLDREVLAKASAHRELAGDHWEHPAQEEQISGIRRLDIGAQRRWRWRQHETELDNA
jgi:hypothetical protein